MLLLAILVLVGKRVCASREVLFGVTSKVRGLRI